MKNNKSPSQVYYEMRDMLMHIDPQELKLKPTKELPTVYGVVMEIGYPDAAVTLFSLADKTVSFYFESGGGYIGLGTHKNIWEKAFQFLKKAEKFRNQCELTNEFPLVKKGKVRFYLLAYDGILTREFEDEEIAERTHGFFPLFYTGHEVISEIRSMDEQKKFKGVIKE